MSSRPGPPSACRSPSSLSPPFDCTPLGRPAGGAGRRRLRPRSRPPGLPASARRQPAAPRPPGLAEGWARPARATVAPVSEHAPPPPLPSPPTSPLTQPLRLPRHCCGPPPRKIRRHHGRRPGSAQLSRNLKAIFAQPSPPHPPRPYCARPVDRRRSINLNGRGRQAPPGVARVRILHKFLERSRCGKMY